MTENSRLRVANSGPRAFAPDFATNAAIGRWLRCVANPDPTRPLDVQWQDLTVQAVVNLSNAVYADGGTSVAPGSQIGNIQAPFGTATTGIAAINALPAGFRSLFMTPGNYSAEPLLTVTGPAVVSIINMTGETEPAFATVSLPQLDGTIDGTNFVLVGLTFTAPVAAGVVRLFGCNCQAAAPVSSGGDIVARSTTLAAGNAAGRVFATDSTLTGNIATNGGSSRLINCRIPGPIDISNTGVSPLQMDGLTYREFVQSGSTVSGGYFVSLVDQVSATLDLVLAAPLGAGAIGFVDSSTLVGTDLADIVAGQAIGFNPAANLELAGGTLLSARAYDSGGGVILMRCCLLGPLAAATYNANFWTG